MTKPIKREALYEMVWAEPLTVLSKKLGYSDVGFAKSCRTLGIPIPPRGYWAKRAAGKAPPRPALPERPTHAENRFFPREPTSQKELDQRARDAKERERLVLAMAAETEPSSKLDPLSVKTRESLKRENGYLGGRGLRTSGLGCLDVEVSEPQIDRAVSRADRIVKLAKRHGATVEIRQGRYQCFLVLAGESFAFRVTEHTKQRQAFGKHGQTNYAPTGELSATIGRERWRDAPGKPLEDQVSAVVAGLLMELKRTQRVRRQQAEAEARRRREEERAAAEERKRLAELQRVEALRQESKRWHEATRLRTYIEAKQSAMLAAGKPPEAVQAWVDWAREQADLLDPLARPPSQA